MLFDHSQTKNYWKIGILFLVPLLIIAGLAYVFFSPYLAVSNMRQAMINKDAKTVASYIDFPKFRENFKAELNAKILLEMNKKQDDNPFAGLGMMMVPTIVNTMVDAFASPAGIEAMMKSDAPNSSAQNSLKQAFTTNDSVEVSTGYESLNEFQIETTDKANRSKGVIMIFERRGITGWQLVNLKMK